MMSSKAARVLCDLSREAPERAAILSVAVRSRHPVRQLGACRRPGKMIIEVDAEHADLGASDVTGGTRAYHYSSSLTGGLTILYVPGGGIRQPSPADAFAAPARCAMLAWRGQNRSLAQREMKSAAECSSRLTKPSSVRPPSPAASNSGLASPV